MSRATFYLVFTIIIIIATFSIVSSFNSSDSTNYDTEFKPFKLRKKSADLCIDAKNVVGTPKIEAAYQCENNESGLIYRIEFGDKTNYFDFYGQDKKFITRCQNSKDNVISEKCREILVYTGTKYACNYLRNIWPEICNNPI